MGEKQYTTRQVGLAAEMYVLYRLSRWKYDPSPALEGLSYDVIADVNGSLLRIQVKGTEAPRASSLGGNSYEQFSISGAKSKPYPTGSYDMLCLVSLTSERMLVKPYTNRVVLRCRPEDFTEEKEKESWDAAILYLRER